MRAIVIGLVFIAIILAGGTAYLLRDYLSTQQAELAAQKPVAPTTRVLVAKNNIPVGTAVNASNTQWIKWPEGEVPAGFIERTKDKNPLQDLEKERHLARRGFVKGEPITMARLYKSDAPGFLRGALDPGMRAVAVRTTAENAASGFILPGDRVDVVLTHDMIAKVVNQLTNEDTPAFTNTSETILENLRVLAVDQRTNEFQEGAAVGKTILLEATPQQAQVLNTAKAMGALTLVLRSAETADTSDQPRFTTDVEVSPLLSSIPGVKDILDDLTANTTARPVAGASVGGASQPQASSTPQAPVRQITIYRGSSSPSTPSGAAQ